MIFYTNNHSINQQLAWSVNQELGHPSSLSGYSPANYFSDNPWRV